MPHNGIMIALDSVGIDPLGHDRPESVYSASECLFPRGARGELLSLPHSPVEGALVETDVTEGQNTGAIECAITYTAHFTGQSAVARHGLLQGLGLRERLLKEMVGESNLFRLFPNACLANAMFPAHLEFFGTSFTQDLLRSYSREEVERHVTFRGEPVRLIGRDKRGLKELYTLAEINQNIFVHAARAAGVPLRTYDDVRRGQALTSSMTHELESEFNLKYFGVDPLPYRSPAEAADVLVALARESPFVFYKYQVADLVSHSGRLDLARDVFRTIEQFVVAVLERIDPSETIVVVTSDHGHLEQVEFHHGHPKMRVPTWYFGTNALEHAAGLRKPESIFHVFAGLTQHISSQEQITT
jgi:hypothetical protein